MAIIVDILIWGIGAIAIGGAVGVIMGKIYFKILKRQEEKRAIEFLQGKRRNNIKLDGKLIDVVKFKVKDNEGKVLKIGVEDMLKEVEKTQSKALK